MGYSGKILKWTAYSITVLLACVGVLACYVGIWIWTLPEAPIGQPAPDRFPAGTALPDVYLDLAKKTLTRFQTQGATTHRPFSGAMTGRTDPLARVFRSSYFRSVEARLRQRGVGVWWLEPVKWGDLTTGGGPEVARDAETMIGLTRLDNIESCMLDAIRNNVPGDFLEAGSWRGGACIFMRAVLKAHDVTDRVVWVADSFEGLPTPDSQVDPVYFYEGSMAVSLEEVQSNFKRYNLLDDQVRFLKGFFEDTLPDAPITQLALLRLDADLYSSTTDALTLLYPKVSSGGYVVVDDYIHEGCRQATDEYRLKNKITEPLIQIDRESVYWKKN